VLEKTVTRKCPRWIPPMLCLSVLTRLPLPAAEPSVSNNAWTILHAGLHDKKADKRALAVSALGLMPGDKQAIETAELALSDPDAILRRAAIAALGDMNAKVSLAKIKALVDHSDPKTVLTIAAVLTKFKDQEGYEIYYELLTGKRKRGGSILDVIKDRSAVEKRGVETAIGFVPFGGIGTGAYDYFKRSGTAQSNLDVIAVDALAHDPDPAAAKQSLQNAEAAIRCAQHYGAETILLVPAVVNAKTRYADAYKRSHKAIQRLIPIAAECGITN